MGSDCDVCDCFLVRVFGLTASSGAEWDFPAVLSSNSQLDAVPVALCC